MMTAFDLANAIGRKKIADTLGVGMTAVSNAVVRGSFPASWFLAIQSLSEDLGLEFEYPPELFNMRMAENKPDDATDQWEVA
ncbi:helix-turn-helix domain containing protein [Pacificibacter marinus]|uniref:helix-turn-helix domain containing protein n=1 Tax=Pacificibacter marinus TaxID=658057 RepID=UPI001C07D27A|nr:helix-turn-helix domain containing protein [Pacificibacter marinus]MBU2868972.1 helix-turn-helix domain containing protein [Pacificibacter marinus]